MQKLLLPGTGPGEITSVTVDYVEQLAIVQQLQDSLFEKVGIDRYLPDVSYPLSLQAEMDSRIAQIQQQLRERDDEVNRLQRELRVRK